MRMAARAIELEHIPAVRAAWQRELPRPSARGGRAAPLAYFDCISMALEDYLEASKRLHSTPLRWQGFDRWKTSVKSQRLAA